MVDDGTELEDLFDDVPFEDNTSPADDPDESADFKGHFGYVVTDQTTGETSFEGDDASSIKGTFLFSVAGSGGKWGGTSDEGNSASGSYAGSGDNKLWGSDDLKHTASDGGRMIGNVGGSIVGTLFNGKMFGIYVDTEGYGGTFSSLFTGDATGGSFTTDDSMEVEFTSRSYLGITPAELDTVDKEEGKLYDGTGKGSFTLVNGSLECTALGGESLKITDESWGIWRMETKGTYTGDTDDEWKLAIGGRHEDASEDTGTWLATASGITWSEGSLTSGLAGVSLYSADEITGRVGATRIFNGYLVGDYCSEEFTWEAIGGGEWVEVTDLLNEANLGFTMAEFNDFVNVPITETYASTVTSAGAIDASMDIHLYTNEVQNIWTGSIAGLHDGSLTDNWNLVLQGSDNTDSVTLAGDMWSDGQWHALVTGTADSGTKNINGEAGGTYDETSMDGQAAGTWQAAGSITAD